MRRGAPAEAVSPLAPPSAPRILIVGPAWVGDMVMAQSLFRLLKQQAPQAQIDVVAPAWTEPLLARMPEVRRAIGLPLGHGQLDIRTRWRLGRKLRSEAYTQAIVLPNSLKSALVPFAAAIPRRTGFTGEWRFGLLNDRRRLDPERLPRTVDRFVALGLAPHEALPPILSPQLKARDARAALARLALNPALAPILALCPGAEYGPAKRWPVEYYAQVARTRLDQGWQVWLFGSAKDTPVTTQVQELTSQRCIDLAGRTALGEAVDLLNLASAIVSNDSGLMHVAAALNKPLIALFGSSDPAHTPPLSDRARVLYLGLSCSPCFARACPLGHLNCLKHLAPEQVLSALEQTA